jgi:hypothetical protein
MGARWKATGARVIITSMFKVYKAKEVKNERQSFKQSIGSRTDIDF